MAKAKTKKQYREKQGNSINTKETMTSLKVTYLSYILLIAIFLFSFYIRGITPMEVVFQKGLVGFATDDSVFHMRLVENTIQFFPNRIFFDAFTIYPYGSTIHWGPLFDQMIAFFAIVAGLLLNGGLPAQSTIDTVGVFFPAVLGALVVFPVYFIGKELFGNKAGLIGAFLIAILPGQFLGRSVLGFTDNHIAEVLFTTLMMMFFIIAIKKAENITLDHWLKRDWATLKVPIIYSLLAGISFGAYLLTWTTGVFFAVVFGIFIITQYIIDHLRGKSTEYLGIVGIIAYFVAMIMVLPYVSLDNRFAVFRYSELHIIVTGGIAVIFAILSLVSREMNKREYKGYHYLLFVLAAITVGIILLELISPDLYNATIGQIGVLFGGFDESGLTIGEAWPTSYAAALGSFGYNYILSYIAIILLCYYVLKKSNAEYSLMVVWSLFVLGIMLAQNRFTYYYAVNVAILSGIIGSIFLDFADWKSFNSNDIIECVKKIRVQHIISLILVIAVIGFLPSGASPYQLTMADAPGGAVSSGFYEWNEALTWMKDNTPVPDLPYYSIYQKPEPGQPYNYSRNDYGVMSWWDYGHIITYWGHRIPNANPFQSGIGGGLTHEPGASTFLTAQTEEEANAVLDKLGINGKPGARYVVSNAYMAYAIQPIFARWNKSDVYGSVYAINTRGGQLIVPGKKYYDTMESRLHIFDTNGMKYYRLVHESRPNPNTQGGYYEVGVYNQGNQIAPVCDQNICVGKYWYNFAFKSDIPVEYSGYAKVFEYVKGARITGSAPTGTNVTLTNTIKTNIGRTIQYKQVTTSNGAYAFTVPYSTLGPIQGETRFDTAPVGPYSVTAGNVSKQVDVAERDVLDGGTITIDIV
ncbi:MAG: oligosaccharyl transferase, archaeosortase A system-associated [Candidatus Methanoperedens sp.]|nr:oligosaccharyl transferase, archaeosortase A system-associated [Candidatus Methanoperedens sp.]